MFLMLIVNIVGMIWWAKIPRKLDDTIFWLVIDNPLFIIHIEPPSTENSPTCSLLFKCCRYFCYPYNQSVSTVSIKRWLTLLIICLDTLQGGGTWEEGQSHKHKKMARRTVRRWYSYPTNVRANWSHYLKKLNTRLIHGTTLILWIVFSYK